MINNVTLEEDFYIKYYELTQYALNAKVLTHFLRHIKHELHGILAIDIGAGAGSDTRLLLKHGATVIGMDKDIHGQAYIKKNTPDALMQNFSWQQQKLEDLHLPKNQLVFSAKTLGFVEEDKFDGMMDTIMDSIEPGGHFVGNFFGHQCNAKLKMIRVTKEYIERLFQDKFTILHLDERKGNIFVECRDTNEDWHFVDLIAQKK